MDIKDEKPLQTLEKNILFKYFLEKFDLNISHKWF